MKRVLSILLTAVLLLSLVPAGAVELALTAKAATELQSGNYTYIVTDGEATITKMKIDISGDVVIPSALGGYPVTSIGYSAFSGCTSLTSVAIPDSVTSIGANAFFFCVSLLSVTIPDSVTSIGNGAFADCDSLTSIVVAEGNAAYCSEDGVLFDKSKAHLIQYPCGKSDTAYIIPNSVTVIEEKAFLRCTALTSVTIPVGVTSIGSAAFVDCDSLTDVWYGGSESDRASITIGEENTSLTAATWHYDEGMVFSYYTCTETDGKVTIVEVDDSISGDIVIPDEVAGYSVTAIGDRAFRQCKKLTSVTIPSSVTRIGYEAFAECYSLTSVTIPDSVTIIREYIFANCRALKAITIPESVTHIGYHAFYDCDALETVTIPDGVTRIGDHAFYDCDALETVTIPDGVTYVGDRAFYDCGALTDVYYGGDETDRANMTIGSNNTRLTSATWHYTCRHRTTTVNGYVAPTCTEDGCTGDTVCADCGETVVASTVIAALGHTETVVGAVDATTATEGYTGDVVCDVCDVVLEEGTVIPVKVASIVGGRYYEDGVKVPYAGLVLYDGNYYYVGDNAKVVTGRFFASRFNDFTQFKNGYYYFDENGVLNTEKAMFDGYYYDESGRGEAYAGLVEVNGAYYYVLEKGEAVVGRYAIVKTNDLKAKGIYCFDAAGKMVTNTVVDGRYYGVSGLSESYVGLVKASDGNLYYVQAQGKVVVNAERFLVSKTNGLVAKGYYAFDENGALTALKVPTAEVSEATAYVNAPIKWENFGAYTPKNPNQQLEAVYKFKAQDTAATIATSPYKDWICDYYVMMDRDVPTDAVVLGGNYGSWGWIGFNNPVAVEANVEVPLLGSVTQNPWTYEMVVKNVGEFLCGVAHVDPALEGATFTVMLRLTNPDNEAEYYNVNTVTYTF